MINSVPPAAPPTAAPTAAPLSAGGSPVVSITESVIPLALVLVVDVIVEVVLSDRALVDPREGTVTVVRLMIVELVEAFVFVLVVGVERGTVEATMVVAVAVVDGGAPKQLRASQKHH
jgi:hypothetical protein